jgi:cation transport regulator ChaB
MPVGNSQHWICCGIVAAPKQVAQDVLRFGPCTAFNVAQHRSRERRARRGDGCSEALHCSIAWRESALTRDCGTLIE